MSDTALLIIDTQVNMFEPDPVFAAETVLVNLKHLIAAARDAGAPVIFIRNTDGSGESDGSGTPGRAIHPELAPRDDEPIVDKSTPDPFHQTRLTGLLAERGIRNLVIAGMLTELCVDTAVRRAASFGYEVTLAADAHSTCDGLLPAEQIIAHHNHVLRVFAHVVPTQEIAFEATSPPEIDLPALTTADLSGIAAGLAEWPAYDAWLRAGGGTPFWPHTHPGYLADVLKQMWDPAFKPRGRHVEPPRWEVGVARAFLQPLENIPPAFRRTALQSVAQAVDHLLQSPTNPLSPHLTRLGETLWVCDARDLRLFYVPRTVQDAQDKERHYVFLAWLAPGVPVRNPFA